MVTKYKNSVCTDCKCSTTQQGDGLVLKNFTTYDGDGNEEKVLFCFNCAYNRGVYQNDKIRDILNITRPGSNIDFSDLLELCKNIIPEDVIKLNPLTVAKYLQFMLQFLKIYLEIGINIDTEEIRLILHPIPNGLFKDRYYIDSFYCNYEILNPLVKIPYQNLILRTVNDDDDDGDGLPKFWVLEHEDKGLYYYIDSNLFINTEECCDRYNCVSQIEDDPLTILEEIKDKTDILQVFSKS